MNRITKAIYYRLFKVYRDRYIKRFKRKSVVISGEKANLDHEVIVSFTTIPSRLPYLPDMMKSIFCQRIQPDRFVMYIYRDEFEGIDIEEILKQEIKNGLEVVYVEENLRSHKKYYYAMKENPDSIVILVDDDTVYAPDMIEKLVASYKRYPQCISAMRCHKIQLLQNGEVAPYNDWVYETSGPMVPSYLNFFTGCGGVLFPPSARTSEFFNIKNIKELSFLADDVWLNFLAIKNGVKTVKATRGKGTPLTIDDNPEESLVYENAMFGNNNDVCVKNMVENYHIDFKEVD